MMTPAVDRLRPGGSEPAVFDQPVEEMVAVDDEVVADRVSEAIAVPEFLVWAPGLVTVTVLLTVQLKVAEPWAPRESVAVSVTEYGVADPVVGVPAMAPVEVLKVSPAGRPVSDHDEIVPPPTTVAEGVNPAMAVPEVEVWAPGLVTVTTSLTVQVNEELVPLNPAESVAVAVTV